MFLPRCEEGFKGVAPCSGEVIALTEPPQLIVLIEHRSSEFQAFLRYEGAGYGPWRFSGAYAPFVKYFRPEHRIVRFGAKPFLVVTGQGNAGTGLSSKVEHWIDLTATSFEPVLDFTAEGRDSPLPDGIGRRVYGTVTSLVTRPVERVTVGMSIEFEAVEDADTRLAIGGRRDRVVYVRAGTAEFKLDGNLSTASPEEVSGFYDDLESGFTDEEFLKFDLKGLMALATGKDEKARRWLSSFLQECSDTAESRQSKAALAERH